MVDKIPVGPWTRRFLLEHLIEDRNLASNTQKSYRDTLALMLPFVATKVGRAVDKLFIHEITPEILRLFLLHLEVDRSSSVATRNQRLAAIHAFARFISEHNPELIAWGAAIRSIPFKKGLKQPMVYLEKPEIDALLSSPNRSTYQGFRDYVMLLFLYNSGARATEAASLRVVDLDLGRSPSVKITGKGRKVRLCPLWESTTGVLRTLVTDRTDIESVFLNRLGQRMTRFGIHALVKRYVQKTVNEIPSLRKKRVSAHSIRHTTAVHLLRAGVDINTIRAWLGHVSLDTTNIYAEVDLEMKAKALAQCEITETRRNKPRWHSNRTVMDFLRSL